MSAVDYHRGYHDGLTASYRILRAFVDKAQAGAKFDVNDLRRLRGEVRQLADFRKHPPQSADSQDAFDDDVGSFND